MLTLEELERIKELNEKASKGPWTWNPKPKPYDDEPDLDGGYISDEAVCGEAGLARNGDYEEAYFDSCLVTETRNLLPAIIEALERQNRELSYFADLVDAKHVLNLAFSGRDELERHLATAKAAILPKGKDTHATS